MALDFEETKKIEQQKHDLKKEWAEIQMTLTEHEHDLKMERLQKHLEIARAGGKPHEG